MKNLIFILGLSVFVTLSAQKDGVYAFTLEEAKKFALEKNLQLKNAAFDIKLAQLKVRETTAIGLPHVDGQGSYSYILTVPSLYEQFIRGDFYSDSAFLTLPPNEQQQRIDDAIDEIRQSTSFDLTVSQLVFSGSYIVGLQTVKIYKNLSNYSFEATKGQVLENVIASYFSVLIAQENEKLLKSSHDNLEDIYSELEEIYKSGFIDENSVNQMKINVLTIKNSLQQIIRQKELAIKLLKIQLGLELEDSIELSDKIEILIPQFENNPNLLKPYIIEEDPNYNLLITQENLQKQNLNLKKSAFLPTISAYYMHHENLNIESVDFQPADQIGVSLNIPIFSSGERLSKLGQAKIEYQKAKNNSVLNTKNLKLGIEEAKSSYVNAMEKLNYNKVNLELATKVYNQTLEQNKYGMASSSEIAQAQNQMFTIQSSYYMSIFELISAKVKIDKAYNQL